MTGTGNDARPPAVAIREAAKRSRSEKMSITESKLSLDPDGDDFVLRRVMPDGRTTTMKLSGTDILTLAQSVPALQQQILSRHMPRSGDHSPVAVTEVVQIALNQESLGEKILLTLIAPSGSRATFAIPALIANLLVERLPVHLARMSAAKPTTKQ